MSITNYNYNNLEILNKEYDIEIKQSKNSTTKEIFFKRKRDTLDITKENTTFDNRFFHDIEIFGLNANNILNFKNKINKSNI